ncbi:hypothetical protein [Paracidovorax wautersii]|uniref:Uncharacterized protein n=1 Tax=Paracidovorax wautersii TaxID=1177982 RepID=A0A1I2HSU1_9BURK|nr:hypothetical protein [Paracidovorax wautersii]SFF32959.1 hypothetical protein SAMN04489711_1328 [Paracidovorax wautersii]
MPRIETKSLLAQLPFSMRQTVLQSSEFQRMCSDFISKHVHANAYGVIDMMRNDPEGRYEEELGSLEGKLDYAAACDENDVQIVEDGGTFYYFQWSDLDTIPLDGDGDCFLDLKGFAQHHGLDLDGWCWDRFTDAAVLKSAVTDEHDVDLDAELISAIGDATADVKDAFQALRDIARYQGKEELAKQLDNTSASSLQKLFGDFVAEMSVLARDEYGSEEDAQRAACDDLRIEPDSIDVYEHWIVSGNFAHWLEKRGEIVSDGEAVDGLIIWGRTTTGQSISMDGTVQAIVADVLSDEVDELVKQEFPNLGSDDEYLVGVPVDMLKALEEGRVVCQTYEFQRYGRTDVVNAVTVLSARDQTLGWPMDRAGYGLKKEWASGEPVPLEEIESRLRAHGEPIGNGLQTAPPSQEQIDGFVRDIAHFHAVNGSSEMHKVPVNLDERLAKLSPAYAAILAAKNDGPSLG